MNVLSRRTHGYLDYLTVLIFLLAPTVIGLTGLPALLAYVLAAVHLLMTVITRFPGGIVKFLPLPLHGWVERAVGVALMVIALIPAFTVTVNPRPRVFYLVMGFVILAVATLSDYGDTEAMVRS